MLKEKGVSNNTAHRGVSNVVDKVMGWTNEKKKEDSGARGLIHGVYHTAIGVGKWACFNTEGSKKEFERAKEQFSRMETKQTTKATPQKRRASKEIVKACLKKKGK